MSGKIPRIFIKELLLLTDIVDVINKRIELKKIGKNLNALCPFHFEKNPSFIVNREKQFYHCFGCGAHGNVIDFLIHYEKLEFVQSIEELAAKNNLKIPYEYNNSFNIKKKYFLNKKLYYLMEKISDFYQQTLNSENSKIANNYLKTRGLNQNIIKHFKIGFAPFGWNNIIKYFGFSKEKIILLKKTGTLVVNNKGQIYDRFRERIVFPIRDKNNHVIAFGGRTLNNQNPKYINSPETEIFQKGKQLYGIYEINKKKIKISKLILVEGYMDVISLAQFGINYAVSSLGTSTTIDHIKLMYSITNKVICCYDGDNAGYQAAWKTLKKSLPYLKDGRYMFFMFLPKGEDPDLLIRKIGKKFFEKLIKKAEPLSEFLFKKILSKVDLSIPEGKSKFSNLILPLINKIPSKILRIFLLQKLGDKIGILDSLQLNNILFQVSKKKIFSLKKPIKKTVIRILISLLLQNPKLYTLVPKLSVLNNLCQPGLVLFLKIVKICKVNNNLTTQQILHYFKKNKYYLQLENLANWNNMINNDKIEETFIDNLTSLYNIFIERRQNILISLDRTRGLTNVERQELWYINKSLSKK